ncbi:SLC13 family permease [Psychrobacter sp. I-STPA6b]|uniref:SLC13 family permease n=1 Tax=Psychrobacter sp. I-STPA6b TaxID=2585718 RepID=UPI001D0C6E3F|nr:DASS family sodium-coupled anion symporter [Psychrobacter sp. I-STPA6b]
MTTPSEFQSEHQPFSHLRGLVIIAIAGILAILLWQFLPFDNNANKGLALLFFIATLWLTEAVHTTITAIMVPVLGVMISIPDIDTKSALAAFANPIIFLFFGGFALAAALQVQRIDKKIALWLIKIAKGNFAMVVISIFIATAFLSMWISNTATTAMMLPLVVGIMAGVDRVKERNTFVFVLLGLGYSAAVGGIGTIVGTPPNAITSQALGLSFAGWMKVAAPFMIVMFPIMLGVLYMVFKPDLNIKMESVEEDIPWTLQRKLTMLVFVVTALSWIFSSFIADATGWAKVDTIIAVSAAIAIGVLGLASWQEISDNTDWGILLLFGGGITLSTILKSSGASLVLGQSVANLLHGAPIVVIIAVVGLFIVFLTEFSSNTATAALLVPVFAGIAEQMGIPQATLVMTIGLGVSMAFMMPVATPPNAIVMGSGLIKQREMMKAGFWLNIIGTIALVIYVRFFF